MPGFHPSMVEHAQVVTPYACRGTMEIPPSTPVSPTKTRQDINFKGRCLKGMIPDTSSKVEQWAV
jgi:hypothetical protein